MSFLRIIAVLVLAILAGCASNTANLQGDQLTRATKTSRTIDLTHPPHDMWDRIRRGFAIPNLQTDLTEQWTNYYASHPESMHRMSQRASKYLYFIVDELERRGMPTELALLPFVESAYNPTAYSKAKASGLWQFIPSTGLYYNLQQDTWRDQRRDPIASTHAALDYLSYLYDFQGDWYLALASYNWGEGAVRRALDKNEGSGLPADYISLTMPEETRNYVPKLQAIKNIIADPKKYGLALPDVSNTPYFTTVKETPTLEIETAAKLAEMPVEEFTQLNASYNRPIILAEHNPTLLLPTDRVEIFNANLRAYQAQLNSWQTYQTRQGESYAEIAQKFGVTLAKLREINGLNGKQARAAAQTLVIPAVETTDGVQLASLGYPSNSPGTAPAAARAVQSSTTARGSDVVVITRAAAPAARSHTVKRGDTLFGLAKRYNTSVSALRKLNNISGSKLGLGTRLRIPATSARS